MSPKSRSFPENGARMRSSSPCARRELPSTRKRWIANRGGAGGLEGAVVGAWGCDLGGCGFAGACAIALLAHSANNDTAAAASKRQRSALAVGVGATLTLPGQEQNSPTPCCVRASVARMCLISGNVVAREDSGISGFALHIVQRSAAERRETGREDEPRVGEVGVGDDAFGDRSLSFLEVMRNELLGEFWRGAARGAFACLAVLPDVEAASGFLAEISRSN